MTNPHSISNSIKSQDGKEEKSDVIKEVELIKGLSIIEEKKKENTIVVENTNHEKTGIIMHKSTRSDRDDHLHKKAQKLKEEYKDLKEVILVLNKANPNDIIRINNAEEKHIDEVIKRDSLPERLKKLVQ